MTESNPVLGIEHFVFVYPPTGFKHVLQVQGNEVKLYTFTAEGCVRPTTDSEGIGLPIYAERKGNHLLVTLQFSDGETRTVEGFIDGDYIYFEVFTGEKILFLNQC